MLKISFDFDEITKTVSNVTVGGVRQRGVIASSSPNGATSDEPDVVLLDNKIQLSKTAMVKLGVKADDRVAVQYISEGIGKSSPVMGKSSCFTDSRDGNRVAAKGTIAFRGEKHDTLAEFGNVFTLEEYKDCIWKLIPYKVSEDDEDETLTEENSDMDNLNNSEINEEIEAIMSSEDDDLPF